MFSIKWITTIPNQGVFHSKRHGVCGKKTDADIMFVAVF